MYPSYNTVQLQQYMNAFAFIPTIDLHSCQQSTRIHANNRLAFILTIDSHLSQQSMSLIIFCSPKSVWSISSLSPIYLLTYVVQGRDERSRFGATPVGFSFCFIAASNFNINFKTEFLFPNIMNKKSLYVIAPLPSRSTSPIIFLISR